MTRPHSLSAGPAGSRKRKASSVEPDDVQHETTPKRVKRETNDKSEAGKLDGEQHALQPMSPAVDSIAETDPKTTPTNTVVKRAVPKKRIPKPFSALSRRERWPREKSRQAALVKDRAKTSSHGNKVRRLQNGLLDVMRKGKYTRLIEQNSKSPLLKLPGEIRNKIFAYAVGGMAFKIKGVQDDDAKLRTIDRNALRERLLNGDVSEDYNLPRYVTAGVMEKQPDIFALLRVCRQIYSETAVLPFKVNTFVLGDGSPNGSLEAFLGNRLPVEREKVEAVEVHMDNTSKQNTRNLVFLMDGPMFDHRLQNNTDTLPNIKHIRAVIQDPW